MTNKTQGPIKCDRCRYVAMDGSPQHNCKTQDTTLEKILDDAFKMGVDHGAGRWNDYKTLKPGMLKKAQTLIKEAIPEKKQLCSIEGCDDHGEINDDYVKGYNDCIQYFTKVAEVKGLL